MIEGRGSIAPKPVRIVLTDHDLLAVIQSVKELNRYSTRTDDWGKGLIGDAPSALREKVSLTHQEVPIVAGKLGEYALWSLATRRFGDVFPPVDFGRRARGDGGIDLKMFGIELQVKTRVTSSQNLVKAFDERGVEIPLTGHAHVFCSWDRQWFLNVLGWIRNKELSRMPVESSRRGSWKNFVMADSQLLPLCRLWNELDLRRGR